jgi:hypothetical protein
MKKIVALLLVALFSVACTPMGKKSYQRVKCPACGHEFESPAK